MKIHLLTSLLLFCISAHALEIPKWADSYKVGGIIQLPYAEIKEDFMSYFDGTNNRSRIDYYGS